MTTTPHDPTLGDVVRDLWAARLWLLAGLVSGIVAGFIMLAVAVPHYRATMMVTPTTRSGTPDISALFPNNASFTMEYVLQSFGPGDSSDFMRFESILRESSVAARLLEDPVVKDGLQRAVRYRIFAKSAPDTPEKLAEWLRDHVQIEPVGPTRLRRLVFMHPDPAFASYMLTALYAKTDALIRQELEAKTEKRLAYLRDVTSRTMHPEHRRILTDLLMDQEQIRMILAVGEPFAASVAEPPSVSSRPYWPRRTVIVPIFALVGLFSFYALYSLRRTVRASRDD